MGVKRAEYMSVESAENFILQHEESAKRLFNRYRKSVQARKLTFDLHRERENEGYKRLQKALEYSKHGMNAESLSYLAYTLASERTSYTDFLRIRKQTFETLNTEFSEYRTKKNGELVITKKFLRNYQEFKEFTDFMDMVRELKMEKMFSSYQLISNISSIIQQSGKKESWKELKERIYNSSERMQEAVLTFLGN